MERFLHNSLKLDYATPSIKKKEKRPKQPLTFTEIPKNTFWIAFGIVLGFMALGIFLAAIYSP
jgi:hypothetical protein